MMHAADDPSRPMLSGWKYPDGTRDVVTYRQAIQRAAIVSRMLTDSKSTNSASLGNRGGFVACLAVPGWEYVASFWGTWAAGKAFVPLALSQKTPELEHVLSDTDPDTILLGGGTFVGSKQSDNQHKNTTHLPPNMLEVERAITNLGMEGRVVRLQDVDWEEGKEGEATTKPYGSIWGRSFPPSLDDPALVLYTSGTTGKPKGVVSTHRNIFHQVTDLVSSWQWTENDVALHVLPLHHIHGVVNVLCCSAYVGANLTFQPFQADTIWKEWADPEEQGMIDGNGSTPKPTVFMAVPTIYAKLLEATESRTAALPTTVIDTAIKRTVQPMRLMVSGSAALPISVLERWERLTGHTLLERYGMTEFAMALSNPYKPDSERHAGHVGLPLPSVQVRIEPDHDSDSPPDGPSSSSQQTSGLLFVKGPTVFQRYLNRPEATAEAFDDDGFFNTGDFAEYNNELGSYRILGRASVDILKVGG